MKLFAYVLLVGVGVLCLLTIGSSAPTFRLGNIVLTPLPPANVVASANPTAAVLTHGFDADACLDLAVVSYGGRTPNQVPPGQLTILFGNCAGAFGASTAATPMLPFGVALPGPVDVTTADFARTGCAGVATANNFAPVAPATATIAIPSVCQLNAPPRLV
jgi:hypothetical protein